MGAGGSKKVKDDLDAARAQQNKNVSPVMEFSYSDDRESSNGFPKHDELNLADLEEDECSLKSEAKSHTRSAYGNEHSFDDDRKSSAQERKGDQGSKECKIPQSKQAFTELDDEVVPPNEMMFLEDVGTPPASSGARKKSIRKKEHKDVPEHNEFSEYKEAGISRTSSGSSRKGGGGRNSSRESSFPLASTDSKKKLVPSTPPIVSNPHQKDQSDLNKHDDERPHPVSYSPYFDSNSVDSSESLARNEHASHYSSGSTPETKECSVNDKDKHSNRQVLPSHFRETPQSEQVEHYSTEDINHWGTEHCVIQSPALDASSSTIADRSPALPETPPRRDIGSIRNSKSPHESNRRIPPSPTYQPKKHQSRLQELQLRNLAELNDDLAHSTSSPHKVSSSISNSSLAYDEYSEGDDALTDPSMIVRKVSHESASLLELQRKRTLSSMHNAKLEMEVESLMRQLAQMDELEEAEEMELHDMALLAGNVVGQGRSKDDRAPHAKSSTKDKKYSDLLNQPQRKYAHFGSTNQMVKPKERQDASRTPRRAAELASSETNHSSHLKFIKRNNSQHQHDGTNGHSSSNTSGNTFQSKREAKQTSSKELLRGNSDTPIVVRSGEAKSVNHAPEKMDKIQEPPLRHSEHHHQEGNAHQGASRIENKKVEELEEMRRKRRSAARQEFLTKQKQSISSSSEIENDTKAANGIQPEDVMQKHSMSPSPSNGSVVNDENEKEPLNQQKEDAARGKRLKEPSKKVSRMTHLARLNRNHRPTHAEEKEAASKPEFSHFEGSKASLGQQERDSSRPKREKRVSHHDFDIEQSPRLPEQPPQQHQEGDRKRLSVSPIRRQRQREVDHSLMKMNEALADMGHGKPAAYVEGKSSSGREESSSCGPSGSTESGANSEPSGPSKSHKGRSVLKNLNRRHGGQLQHVESNSSLDFSIEETSVDLSSGQKTRAADSHVPAPIPERPAEEHVVSNGPSSKEYKGVAALKKKKGRAPPKHSVDKSPAETREKDPWSETMDMRRMEVDLMLRKPINSDSDVNYTLAAAEAGLMFMEELDRVAKSLHILRGTLSRWLLPYDNNTAISDQASTVQSVVDAMPDSIRGKLTEKQVHYLVSGLNSVRQLIRVKIADDNDLEQARAALKTAADFLRRLQSEAEKSEEGMSAYSLLQSRAS